jgi:hypothetical protein
METGFNMMTLGNKLFFNFPALSKKLWRNVSRKKIEEMSTSSLLVWTYVHTYVHMYMSMIKKYEAGFKFANCSSGTFKVKQNIHVVEWSSYIASACVVRSNPAWVYGGGFKNIHIIMKCLRLYVQFLNLSIGTGEKEREGEKER